MTTPDSFGQFGQTLAFAERTMTEVLRKHLAERQTAPETWYALKLLGTREPGLSLDALTADLAGSRSLNPDSARQLLARLEAEGLICGGTDVALTDEGQRVYAGLREYVSRPAIELLGRFDVADIDTTVRTLQAITRLAADDLVAHE
jgi:DNA-binding MarR family transcriptional regulator